MSDNPIFIGMLIVIAAGCGLLCGYCVGLAGKLAEESRNGQVSDLRGRDSETHLGLYDPFAPASHDYFDLHAAVTATTEAEDRS